MGKLIVNKLLSMCLLSGCAVMASREGASRRPDRADSSPPGSPSRCFVVRVHPEMSADLVRLLNGVTCAVAARNAHVAAKLEDLGRRPEQPEVAK